MNAFDKLFTDPHLSLIVFSNLDHDSLNQCCRVCKNWHHRFFFDELFKKSLIKINLLNKASSIMKTKFDHTFGINFKRIQIQ